jgi:hypothetical protein
MTPERLTVRVTTVSDQKGDLDFVLFKVDAEGHLERQSATNQTPLFYDSRGAVVFG